MEGATAIVAKSTGRVAIGLGNKGALEAGLTLSRTWGTPVLPGSALKGIAAKAARTFAADDAWRTAGESYQALFGTTDDCGCVTFHDAWWIAGSTKSGWIAPDVITVHHSAYYTGDGDSPPSDMDAPIPNAFATVHGKFEIVLTGPEAWRQAALEWLKVGLDRIGIGAKTSAGYGRFRFETAGALRAPSVEEPVVHVAQQNVSEVPALPEDDELSAFRAQIATANAGNVTQVLDSIERATSDAVVRRAAAEAIQLRLSAATVRKAANREKAWALRIQDWLK